MKKEQLKNTATPEEKKIIALKNEVVINRLMLVFALAITVITALVVIHSNNSAHAQTMLREDMPLFIILFGILTALAAAFAIVRIIKKVDESIKALNSKHLLGISVLLLLGAIALWLRTDTVTPVLIALSISATFLYFINYLYQREYMLLASVATMGAFGVYYAANPSTIGFIARIFMAVLPIVVLLLMLIARRSDGFIGKLQIFKEKRGYLPLVFLCALLLAVSIALIAAPIVFSGFSVYLIITVIAYALAFGIVYTVKMI